MSALWPHWLRPFWLLLLPLLLWLLWRLWHRQLRIGRWQMLLPPAFHAALLSAGSGRRGRLRWVVLGLAWLLAWLALLGPSWQRLEQPERKPVAPLVAILELTPQMLAGDLAPTRLEQARRKLHDLLEARRDSQTALVVYAGSAHTLVPLSDDLATSANLLDALKPSIMPEPGQRADLAVQRALQLLDQGASGRGRLLLICGDLSDAERSGIAAALDGRNERLDILGVGSAEGAPIVSEDGGFLKDADGAILLPRLDADSLREFAQNLGGAYRTVRPGDDDLRQLGLLRLPAALSATGENTRLEHWSDQGHWLLLPLLLLAACAGRRGWLFGLALLILPPSGQAFELDDLWLRPDQQGQRLLDAQRPAEAAQRFEDPQRQGLALYLAGDYAAAAERFALDDSAVGHYNRGNALARAEQFEAALDAYDQALERQPELAAAQANKALIEALLRQRQANPPATDESANQSAAQQPQDSASGAQAGTDSDAQPAAGSPSAAGASAGPAGSAEAGQGSEQSPAPGSVAADPASTAAGENTATAAGSDPGASASEAPDETEVERRQAREQWLRQIPDDPGELLRRKFWYEQQQHREQP